MKEKLILCLLNRVKYDSSLTSFSASWPVNSFSISANYLFFALKVFLFSVKIYIYIIFFWLCSYSSKIFQNYLVLQLHFFCRN